MFESMKRNNSRELNVEAEAFSDQRRNKSGALGKRLKRAEITAALKEASRFLRQPRSSAKYKTFFTRKIQDGLAVNGSLRLGSRRDGGPRELRPD
jgi:hypothetical protein